MLEYIDLALSLVLVFSLLYFVFSQYKLLGNFPVLQLYQNYQAVNEVYHIFQTHVVQQFSPSSKFSIIFYNNGSLFSLIPSITQGGKNCFNVTLITKNSRGVAPGNLTVEICY
ncbi:MAG: hypothetical protein GXO42_02930 [bacterium]|nr:hypothetical protein [bacterium]